MRKKKTAQAEFEFQESSVIASLSEREQNLDSKIEEMKRFIEEEPKKIEAAERKRMDQLRTIAPPDEIADQRRLKRFEEQLSRGELINEYRYQAQNGLLFVLLVAMICGVAYWIMHMLQL